MSPRRAKRGGAVFSFQISVFRNGSLYTREAYDKKGENTVKDEKKVKLTEEEAKKEVQTEEEGVQLTDEELSSVAAGGYIQLIDPNNIVLR